MNDFLWEARTDEEQADTSVGQVLDWYDEASEFLSKLEDQKKPIESDLIRSGQSLMYRL